MVTPTLRQAGLLLLLGPLLLALGCGGEAPATAPPSADAPVATGEGAAEAEAARQPPAVAVAWRGEGRDLKVSVWEMHCPGCELEVEDLLKVVPGIETVRADWETSEVVIRLEASASREAVIDAVREAIHANERQILGEDVVGP